MITSLLHLVGLRPRVYYTLTNFREGGGARPPWSHLQYANDICPLPQSVVPFSIIIVILFICNTILTFVSKILFLVLFISAVLGLQTIKMRTALVCMLALAYMACTFAEK